MTSDWRAASLALLLLQAAATAQAKPVSGCSDDRGVDRCDPAQHRRVLKLFGAPPIEQHRDAGDLVRRVFYVDGYGKDLVGIAFIRSRGRDPQLKVYLQQPEGGPPRPPLEASVPAPVWDELVRRSAFFHRRLISPPPPPKDVIILCGHAWVMTGEAVDEATSPDEPPPVRRRTEDACFDGLTEMFAEDLYKMAFSLLPQCALLELRRYRNEAELLSACGILAGDRASAALAMNSYDALEEAVEEESQPYVQQVIVYGASLIWDGKPIASEAHGAASAWLAMRKGPPRTDLWLEAAEGMDPDRARLTGLVERESPSATGGKSVTERATFEQIWARNGDRFAIEKVTVGRFEKVADPEP